MRQEKKRSSQRISASGSILKVAICPRHVRVKITGYKISGPASKMPKELSG